MLTFTDNDHPELQEAARREFAGFMAQVDAAPLHSPLRATQAVALCYKPEAIQGDAVKFYMAVKNGNVWEANLKTYVRDKSGNYVRSKE